MLGPQLVIGRLLQRLRALRQQAVGVDAKRGAFGGPGCVYDVLLPLAAADAEPFGDGVAEFFSFATL